MADAVENAKSLGELRVATLGALESQADWNRRTNAILDDHGPRIKSLEATRSEERGERRMLILLGSLASGLMAMFGAFAGHWLQSHGLAP